MNLANTNATCIKCSGTILARTHYATWSRKNAQKIWHIDCSNPSLEGFDRNLLVMKGTFFMKYPNTCTSCSARINIGELAMLTKGETNPKHAACNNPTGRTSPSAEPAEPTCIDPSFEPSFKPEPRIITPASDGLLKLIVDSVSSELNTRVTDAISQVTDEAKSITDRLEKELSEKLKDLAIPSIQITRPDLSSIKIDNTHKQFKTALEYLNAGENLYIWGAPGAGKTHLGPQLAQALGVGDSYFCISLSEQSPEYKITGFTSPVTCEFVESQFIKLYENGGFFHFSELDAANDNFRVSLNNALENGYFSTDRGMIKRHANFFVLADGNTAGRGAHPAFPSRIPFDAAFAARFQYLEFEYDWQLAKQITKSINPDCLDLVPWFEAASAWAFANKIQVVLSPRELYKLAKLRKVTSIDSSILFEGILRGLDIVSKEKLLENHPLPVSFN